MANLYTAKVVYDGEGVAISFAQDTIFSDFCSSIRSRFQDLSNSLMKLRYNVFPDATIYHMDTEADFRLLFKILARYTSDYVEVSVTVPEVIDIFNNAHGNVVSDESMRDDENEFLGCYRRDDLRPSLSDSWGTLIHSVGQTFEGGVKEFMEKLRMYAIGRGFGYTLSINNKKRVEAYCRKKGEGVCDWSVKASLVEYKGFFVIKQLLNEHKCVGVVRQSRSSMMGSKVVKAVMLGKIHENPNKKAIDIQHELKSDYGLDVPYRTAWYGKEIARETVIGDEPKSYSELQWYCNNVLFYNPDARISIEHSAEDNRFLRMFVCYGALMKGFLCCRPILFVDATFLTGKYKGVLLAASTKDGTVIKPPLTKRPPGRPRTRRFRSRNEVTRSIRCGRCGIQDGHNRASCKNPI